MDLLGGYGSDASSDHDAEPAAPPQEGRQGLLSNMPPPSTSGAPSAGELGKLPPPRRSRKPVQFKVAIPVIPDSDDEEDMPRKKVKLDTRGKALGDVLPAPKNNAASLGALGAGGSTRLMMTADDDDFRDAPPTGDGVLGGREAYLGAGDNEAFRVDEGPVPEPLHPGGGLNGAAHHPRGQNGHHGGAHAGAAAAGPTYRGHEEQQQAPGEAMLAQALAADAKGAARRGVKDPFADLDVKFVEVDQKKLKYVNPMAKAEANAARAAFGADYEATLRREAGPQPDKLARRKHQISSLYHQAKMKELEMLDMRGQGLKTKAETQAKYGW